MTGLVDYFAGRVAERYDDAAYSSAAAVEPIVDFLEPLAGAGALEFAVGTGRIAVPLAARGVRVEGIDLSPDMVAQLRRKDAELPVTIGDMTTTSVDGSFSLVYLVFNTIGNLTSQDAQVACFRNAAAHLHAGGAFVVETGVPRPGPLRVFDLGETHVGIDEYDEATQRLVSHHVTLVDGAWERLSVPFRSVSPAELDLMARLAGMTLVERWGGWRREPFTAESPSHVSVWRTS
jgi:SAM-dependent methyltransferase